MREKDDSTRLDFIFDACFNQALQQTYFLTIIAGLAMLTSFNHHFLWSPDEPREAEIARETLVDNHWITPHLCGLPFLEKPPLYYNLVALAYRVTGSITPPAARAVSLTFGISMLAVVFYWIIHGQAQDEAGLF